MKRSILMSFFVFCLFTLSGQEIKVNKIALLDKLPVNAIHRLFEDSEGYLWYGTINGLCRDDGYNIRIFRSDLDNPALFNQNEITGIAEDNRQNLWIGTTKGAYYLDKKTYKIHPVQDINLANKNIISVHTDPAGYIWIGILGGLFQYNADQILVNAYPMIIDNIEKTIHSLIRDNQQNLLISIWKNGVVKLDEETNSFVPFTTKNFNSNVTCILQDKEQSYYWLGTWDEGIVKFDPSAPEGFEYQYQPIPVNCKKEEDSRILHIVQDNQYGYLWVIGVTDLFAFEIKNDQLVQIDISSYFPDGTKLLADIILSEKGNLWVAAYNRESFMIQFQEKIVNEYPLPGIQKHLQGTSAIVSMARDHNRHFWLSQERLGLFIYSAVDDRFTYYKDCPEIKDLHLSEISQIIYSSASGKIWVAPYSSILYNLYEEDLTIKLAGTVDLNTVTAQPGQIESLYEDAQGNLWIGTTTGLYLYRTRSNQLKVISEKTGKVTGITSTPDENIWICTDANGLFKITKDREPESFPQILSLCCIDASTDGKLWLGTEQGHVLLFNSSSGSWQDLSRTFNMNGDIVNKIIVDNYNHVWILNNQKLTEYNPNNGAFHTYQTSNKDILLNRFLPRSIFKDDKDGLIYFGGMPGIISVRPGTRLETISRPVTTKITNINILGESALFGTTKGTFTDNKLTMAPEEQHLEIFFSALDHAHTQHIRYAYKMNGIDSDWIYTSHGKNSAFYNNLPKGNYIFQVKATDNKGIWSDQITQITIHRLPAIYETWWAYLLYILAIGSITGSIVYLYLQRINDRNDKILTEKIAQLKLRYFTNISHDLLTPLTVISCITDELKPAEPAQIKNINLLRTNVSRLKRLIQQVLDFRKSEFHKMILHISKGNISEVIRSICQEDFSPLIKQKNILIDVVMIPEKIEGFFDRDKLDKILFNLVSNAIKYTPEGKKVWVHAEIFGKNDTSWLKIEVGDEGIGIPLKEQENIFTRFYSSHSIDAGQSNGVGLSLTKELVELHHGTIQVKSIPEKGSVFTVIFPIDKNEYNAGELSEMYIPADQKESIPAVWNEPGDKQFSLLLVEDNRDLLQLMKENLSNEYQIFTATNGKEALDHINDIDIVVSDVMMPEINGLELCKKIKTDIATSHVLFLLLTAKTNTDDQVEAFNAGADGYLTKPFEMRLLKSRIRNLLQQRIKKQQEFRQEQDLPISTEEFTSIDEEVIEKAIRAIEKNLTDPEFDVNKLAGQLHMSRSTLSRKIKTLTGMTCLDFIRNIKMKHACRMLINKHTTISEVAWNLGYNNRKYFAICFKEEFGITPTEYQKKHTSGSIN